MPEALPHWKLVYPETGFPTKTLILGIVEVDPGQHSPLRRHNCEEVYYVLQGRGEIESDNARHPFAAGDAVYNREGSVHRAWNTGTEPVRLCLVGGIMFVGLVPNWPARPSEQRHDRLDGNHRLHRLRRFDR